MNDLIVTCDSCGRSWTLHLQDTPYLQLDLSSRPCPHCEAYTLSCHSSHDAAPRDRRLRRPVFPEPAPRLAPTPQ